VCADGSTFVDRDDEHFGHVLEYMRDGVVSAAEPGVCPSISLLRALKREFGFYCIDLCTEKPMVPHQPEVALVMGGYYNGSTLASMERYDLSSGQWSAAAAMITARRFFGACTLAGELYVAGGFSNEKYLSSVEKYTTPSDTWSAMAPLPSARHQHAAVAVGSSLYVLGGLARSTSESILASVFKYSTTARRARGVRSSPCPRQDGAMLHARSEVISTSSGVVVCVSKIKNPSSSSTRRPTYGARWSPCHSLSLHMVSVCSTAIWSTLSELDTMARVSCASMQHLESGARFALQRTASLAVQPLCSADVCMRQAEGAICRRVWSDTMCQPTHGRPSLTCSRPDLVIAQSRVGLQTLPRSRTFSTR
jgi:hypothetical protein